MFQGVYVMILLDTCALLWFLHDDPMLPERVAERIEKSEKAYLSIASLWEVAIKKTIKKLDIPETVKELEKKCEEKQIIILPIKTDYLEMIQNLPMIHADPFDRLIMATAIEENLTLLTDDGKIRLYESVMQEW